MCSLLPYVLGICLAGICKDFVYILTVVIKKIEALERKMPCSRVQVEGFILGEREHKKREREWDDQHLGTGVTEKERQTEKERDWR